MLDTDATRRGVDALIAYAAARMHKQSADYRNQAITAAAWIALMQGEIKAVHIAAALAAYGGRDQMDQRKWGVVGQIIRQQYQFQRAFVLAVLSGKQRQNGHMDARAMLYAQAARVTYLNIQRRVQADDGMRWERNELGAHESCRGCIGQAALGWVPIGTLIPIGSRQCGPNCRCAISYSETRPHAGP